MKQNTLPFNLQFFAESAGDAGADTGAGEGTKQQTGQQTQPFEFDYEKLASIVNGKQSVTEDTVLKNYFKQQGLSQEEATQAMQQFKEQKAKKYTECQCNADTVGTSTNTCTESRGGKSSNFGSSWTWAG